ncbi:STAS domain-containing protein [Streptomyces sp. NPDC092369]|uniref:STAS domain-containing protein n=1 Tax=Streptomyces sp. NPDC092369 TaxID=3366015 RepID=UPI00382EA69D
MLPDSGASPQHLSVHTADHDGVSVVTPVGEIDSDSCGALRAVLQNCVEGTGRIAIDFSGVSFMDSSGINVLLSAAMSLRDRPGAWLRVVAPSQPVLRVLQLVGVEAVLPVRDSLADALAD